MKREMITITPARGEEDAPFIARAVAAGMGEEAARRYCGADFLSVLEAAARRPDTQYSFLRTLIAVEEGETVGAAVCYAGNRLAALRRPTLSLIRDLTGRQHEMPDEAESDEYYLDTLFVLPERRGRGYGTALIEEVKKAARESGLSKAGLLADPENVGALRLYRACGFEEEGTKEFLGSRMLHLVCHA